MGCPDVQFHMIALGFTTPMHIPEELKTHFKFHSPYCNHHSHTLLIYFTSSVGARNFMGLFVT